MNDWDKIHAILVWVLVVLATIGFGVMIAMWIGM
jgi:hypothetical protein